MLARIDPRDRVETLIESRGEAAGMPSYSFDIRLQGPDETVFLDV